VAGAPNQQRRTSEKRLVIIDKYDIHLATTVPHAAWKIARAVPERRPAVKRNEFNNLCGFDRREIQIERQKLAGQDDQFLATLSFRGLSWKQRDLRCFSLSPAGPIGIDGA
jgi:hypothetical protein